MKIRLWIVFWIVLVDEHFERPKVQVNRTQRRGIGVAPIGDAKDRKRFVFVITEQTQRIVDAADLADFFAAFPSAVTRGQRFLLHDHVVQPFVMVVMHEKVRLEHAFVVFARERLARRDDAAFTDEILLIDLQIRTDFVIEKRTGSRVETGVDTETVGDRRRVKKSVEFHFVPNGK